ncbi:MAG: winged helix-turn-helix domain-containing protein [Candidatus Rariloculaceae bacterium]
MGAEIFLIQEDATLSEMVLESLRTAGYSVEEDTSLEEAWQSLKNTSPTVILLPWTSESEVKATLSALSTTAKTVASRVIVLAPKIHIKDAFISLEHGADDCLAIPFVTEELVGRVNVSIRRARQKASADENASGVVLDRTSHRLFVDDEYVELSPTEFRLMAFFIENPGRMFSREELLSNAWPSTINASRRTVDVHVRRLRGNLDPYGYAHLIETVRGFGYRFSRGKPGGQVRPISREVDPIAL